MRLEGEWSAHNGGYGLKIGEIFLGFIRQRGGDGRHARCWIVSLNGKHIGEENDRDYAQAQVEQLICDEIQRITPVIQRITARLPPPECFEGEDCESRWINWKVDKEIAGWSFTAPTLHAQRRAALKMQNENKPES